MRNISKKFKNCLKILVLKMENDDDSYDDSLEESPEEMLDEDALSPQEEAFLKGYDESDEDETDEDAIDAEFE